MAGSGCPARVRLLALRIELRRVAAVRGIPVHGSVLQRPEGREGVKNMAKKNRKQRRAEENVRAGEEVRALRGKLREANVEVAQQVRRSKERAAQAARLEAEVKKAQREADFWRELLCGVVRALGRIEITHGQLEGKDAVDLEMLGDTVRLTARARRGEAAEE